MIISFLPLYFSLAGFPHEAGGGQEEDDQESEGSSLRDHIHLRRGERRLRVSRANVCHSK